MPADYRPAGGGPYFYQNQADAFLDQAAPVQNTWYTVLNTSLDVRIISIAAKVLVATETAEGRITLDGIVVPITVVNLIFGNVFEVCNLSPFEAYYSFLNPTVCHSRSFFLEAQSFKLEIRKTSANGAGNLQCRVKWARWLPT